jgi:2,3-bisphosphoglycerate-dependent phosphoglycerate mutase
MGNLIMVRHGKSEFNIKNLFTGWTDVDLAPEGVEEAKKAGEIIKKNDIVLDVCFSSYLKRAIRTAWIVLETAEQMPVDCIHGWKLNERHYGAWQGKNKEEIKKNMDDSTFEDIHRGYETPPPPLDYDDPRNARFEQKYKRIDASLLPATESLKDTEKRVVNYYYEAIVPQLMQQQTVLLACHGNTLRALREHIEKIAEGQIGSIEVPTGVPYLYEFDGELNLKTHYELN